MIIPKIKICGITSKQDAEIAVAKGADTLGFVSNSVATGPANVNPRKVSVIISEAGISKPVFLLTGHIHANDIIIETKISNCNYIQMVKPLKNLDEYKRLYQEAKKLSFTLIQVIQVSGKTLALNTANRICEWVDGYLFDSGNTQKHCYGGTGRTHDWGIDVEIAQQFYKKIIILAGGLNASNVQHAINIVRPNWIDVYTGVRNQNGFIDEILLVHFIETVHAVKD